MLAPGEARNRRRWPSGAQVTYEWDQTVHVGAVELVMTADGVVGPVSWKAMFG